MAGSSTLCVVSQVLQRARNSVAGFQSQQIARVHVALGNLLLCQLPWRPEMVVPVSLGATSATSYPPPSLNEHVPQVRCSKSSSVSATLPRGLPEHGGHRLRSWQLPTETRTRIVVDSPLLPREVLIHAGGCLKRGLQLKSSSDFHGFRPYSSLSSPDAESAKEVGAASISQVASKQQQQVGTAVAKPPRKRKSRAKHAVEARKLQQQQQQQQAGEAKPATRRKAPRDEAMRPHRTVASRQLEGQLRGVLAEHQVRAGKRLAHAYVLQIARLHLDEAQVRARLAPLWEGRRRAAKCSWVNVAHLLAEPEAARARLAWFEREVGISAAQLLHRTNPSVFRLPQDELEGRLAAMRAIFPHGRHREFLRKRPWTFFGATVPGMRARAESLAGLFGARNTCVILARRPELLTVSWEHVETNVLELERLLGRAGTAKVVVSAGSVLTLPWERLQEKIDYVVRTMGRDLGCVERWPSILGLTMENIRSRYEVLNAIGVAGRLSFCSVYGCSNADFKRRFGLDPAPDATSAATSRRKKHAIAGPGIMKKWMLFCEAHKHKMRKEREEEEWEKATSEAARSDDLTTAAAQRTSEEPARGAHATWIEFSLPQPPPADDVDEPEVSRLGAHADVSSQAALAEREEEHMTLYTGGAVPEVWRTFVEWTHFRRRVSPDDRKVGREKQQQQQKEQPWGGCASEAAGEAAAAAAAVEGRATAGGAGGTATAAVAEAAAAAAAAEAGGGPGGTMRVMEEELLERLVGRLDKSYVRAWRVYLLLRLMSARELHAVKLQLYRNTSFTDAFLDEVLPRRGGASSGGGGTCRPVLLATDEEAPPSARSSSQPPEGARDESDQLQQQPQQQQQEEEEEEEWGGGAGGRREGEGAGGGKKEMGGRGKKLEAMEDMVAQLRGLLRTHKVTYAQALHVRGLFKPRGGGLSEGTLRTMLRALGAAVPEVSPSPAAAAAAAGTAAASGGAAASGRRGKGGSGSDAGGGSKRPTRIPSASVSAEVASELRAESSRVLVAAIVVQGSDVAKEACTFPHFLAETAALLFRDEEERARRLLLGLDTWHAELRPVMKLRRLALAVERQTRRRRAKVQEEEEDEMKDLGEEEWFF